jgi:hypothetical protein
MNARRHPWLECDSNPQSTMFGWTKIFLWTGDQPVANPLRNTNTDWTHADSHALNGIWNHNPKCSGERKYFFGRGISPSQIRYLTQTQNERTQTFMPWMGFEHTIPLFEWTKIFLGTGDQPVANPLPNTNKKWTHADSHALNGIRTHNPQCSGERKYFLGRGIGRS